jgi:hypothetical protein
MDDTIDPDEREGFKGLEVGKRNPADWISEDGLLFNTIQDSSSAHGGESEAYVEADEDFGDEEEYEDEHRCSTVRALAVTDPNWPPSL